MKDFFITIENSTSFEQLEKYGFVMIGISDKGEEYYSYKTKNEGLIICSIPYPFERILVVTHKLSGYTKEEEIELFELIEKLKKDGIIKE